MSAYAARRGATAVEPPVRVMLVDDSGVARALMSRWLDESGVAEVVVTAANGRAALDALGSHEVDVVVLDIEMPELDGLSALPRLLALRPGLQVLMASQITVASGQATLQALRLGAADTIAKPRSGWAGADGPDFRISFLAKVLALGLASRRPRDVADTAAPAHPRAAPSATRPQAIVIGASTGGPNALFRIVGALPAALPVLITQHMPPTFTAILAEHLSRHTGRHAYEASEGMVVRAGHVYVAPGDRHMLVAGSAARASIALSDAPPESFCRPSVNPLMRSAARVWGSGALGIMLTGMGSDGLDGARALVAAGGTLVAQDQATSVVWGMPGAVARAGLAAEVLPLDAIPDAVARRIGRAA